MRTNAARVLMLLIKCATVSGCVDELRFFFNISIVVNGDTVDVQPDDVIGVLSRLHRLIRDRVLIFFLPVCFRRTTADNPSLCPSSTMASALISVPTTASRFALLQVDSASDSDSDTGKSKSSRETGKSSRPGKSAGAKGNQTTDKKKDKKKRKKEQQQSETNEVNR